MSDFDANRALAILNRASENGMYDPTKIPEFDADKIAAAEQTVQLCQQVEQVVQAAFPGETDERVIAQKVPHWPGVVKTLAEAHVFVGANEPEPPPETADNPDPSPYHDRGATEDSLDYQAAVGLTPESPIAPPVRGDLAPDQEDPKNGEVWLDQRGNAWLIVSYSGGTSAEVKSMKSGEATIVPAGFLKKRDRDQETSDYEKPPAEMTREEADKVEDGLLGEPHGLAEEFQRARQETTSTPLADAILPSGDSPQIRESKQNLEVALNSALPEVMRSSLSPQPQETGHEPLSSDPSIVPTSWKGFESSPAADVEEFAKGVRAESDRMNEPSTDAAKESAKYDDLVENVEQRYRPVGMPVPTDLIDPPTISAEQFADIDDATARILHARFNALAARAKYLHDVEAAIARECDLVKTYHMRRAMAAARRELGKDATVAEVKIVAEGDQLVDKWADYFRTHSEEAKALKTFHDIYTQHVVVLSRDWSMREAQVR